MAITYSISINSLFCAKGRDNQELNRPYTFVIPSYQRGYRWEPVHIKHLFDDLYSFKHDVAKDIENKYCLQPIIVKPIDELNNRWELVDGQQRLTSLWLMRQLCFAFRNEDEDDEENKAFYNLEFEGKPEFSQLISAIREKACEGMNGYIRRLKNDEAGDFLYEEFNVRKQQNIDVDSAIECIRTILLENSTTTKLRDIFSSPINYAQERTSDSVLLIWYQLKEQDNPVTVFSNINANKIKLTESELIKAQILSSLSGDNRDQDEASIATRWEAIERALCQDEFWYFLNAGSGKETGTRIDFLFDIWKEMPFEQGKLESANNNGIDIVSSDYPLSDLVENTLKLAGENRTECAKAIWAKISELFDSLLDWKNDYYFYHVIGLLIAVTKLKGETNRAASLIKTYICVYKNELTSKDEFRDYLKTEIRDIMYQMLDNDTDKNFFNFASMVKSLSYYMPIDQKKIRIILLMYNIASLINAQNEHERFPFDLFFADKYDIEHVNPQNPDEDNQESLELDEIEKWFSALGIKSEFKNICDQSKSEVQRMENLLTFASKYSTDHKLNSIGNLVLLDSNTNRGYQNVNFAEKRKDIVDILRTGKRRKNDEDNQEKYIPIGTKWVFLKAFSDMSDDLLSVNPVWDGNKDYEDDIIRQLWFLQSGFKKERMAYTIYSSKEHKNIPVAVGLVMDKNGDYFYIDLNSDQDRLINYVGIKDIIGEKTNGLIDEGLYYFDGYGNIEACVSDNTTEGGATA